MRRPNYGAVTGVTTVLAGVCAVRLAFQGLIPPPNPDIARWGRGEFVARAQAEAVQWRPLDQKALDAAQSLSRPLIVVVGVPWSGVGRQADASFASPEVARAINRGFVAVRIDAAQEPRWLSQFLPLTRTRSPFGVGFQAWVFDLKGRLIDFVAQIDAKDELGPTAMLDALLAAQNDFAKDVLNDATPSLEATQQADVARLLQPALADLALPDAALGLEGGLDPVWGGWTVRGLLPNRPLTFRFLQLAGRWAAAGDSLRRSALSPRADWLDGGFFRGARADLRTPEYDKPTVLNAQIAETMAVQDAIRPDPLLRRTAKATVAWILTLVDDDLLPGAEGGDEDEQGRSARSSFSPARLRDAVSSGALTPDARDWAVASLGLAPPARVIAPIAAAVDDARLEETLESLRRAAGPRRKVVAPGLCDVNGTVAACLFRCARLWDDPEIAAKAGAIVDRLEAFADGPDLHHSLRDPSDAIPYLGDSLAYADTEMEDFLTDGRVPSLERGAAALRRAMRRFGGVATPGILHPSPDGTMLLRDRAEVPQVTDDEREALSATALRLLDAYAVALGPAGADLARIADDVDARIAAVADVVPSMGGSLAALARHADRRAAFVVGPDAPARAARLARRLPNRLVVPVVGPARPELGHRHPGVYVETPTGLVGPLSEDAAVTRLPNDLSLEG